MERGIFPYINEDIPFKAIRSKQLPGNLEILTLGIILDKMKNFFMRLYKPPSFNEEDCLFHLNNANNFFLHHIWKCNADRRFQYDTRKPKIK